MPGDMYVYPVNTQSSLGASPVRLDNSLCGS